MLVYYLQYCCTTHVIYELLLSDDDDDVWTCIGHCCLRAHWRPVCSHWACVSACITTGQMQMCLMIATVFSAVILYGAFVYPVVPSLWCRLSNWCIDMMQVVCPWMTRLGSSRTPRWTKLAQLQWMWVSSENVISVIHVYLWWLHALLLLLW